LPAHPIASASDCQRIRLPEHPIASTIANNTTART
jgi:hypothetical protein